MDYFQKNRNVINIFEVERVVCSQKVEMHSHNYYELFLVEKGSCTHEFNNSKALLVPGDCFLLPANRAHGFTIHSVSSIFNCQFFLEELSDEIASMVIDLEDMLPKDIATPVNLDFDINDQGIIHLEPHEMSFLITMLYNMLEEQDKGYENYALMKTKYLEILILMIKRKMKAQYESYIYQLEKNDNLIFKILNSIEMNLDGDIDFQAIAQKHNISLNHFRRIFKETTGLTPVDYLNRLRITRASHMLVSTDKMISEIALEVGLYDYNYFSRLFKKYVGCSPRLYSKSARKLA
ncbi:AraC family transcriptional regulator [Vibrio viridaestus]|uniref:AraC family transcriptional regulator n=1 Tax=Vibrio viridaestus TaxID=2487322 RepID=A0A3N9TKB9_9VIBR|nr:AraC family transcriptional regulator [Vibrio viridaestus]RQW64838.1 AraC family transcriptional regulator [Vibrio viridaestus]